MAKRKQRKKKVGKLIRVPEKREDVLYARIKPTNKEFISLTAQVEGMSISHLMDEIIEEFRRKYVGKQKRSRTGS